MAFAARFIREEAGTVLSVSAVYRDTQFRYPMQNATLNPLLVSEHVVRPDTDPKADRQQYNLVTQGVHLVDCVRYLAGDVTAVTAQVATGDGNWSWHGLLEFAGGARGHFELTCKACADWCERYEVLAERGSATVELPLPFYHRPGEARCFDGRTQQWSAPLGARSNAYANQLDHFAAAVLDNRPTSPDAADGLAAVVMLEAIAQSVATGRRVAIDQPVGAAT
jgi:predicted dehydrogenase